jgi:hypothetical protein
LKSYSVTKSFPGFKFSLDPFVVLSRKQANVKSSDFYYLSLFLFHFLRRQKTYPLTLKGLLSFALLAAFFLFSHSAFSQNTKGDRPVKNQRTVRETKGKSVKRKEKGSTKDLAGRRLRTKNKSSANRANSSFPQFSPNYQSKKGGGDRASKSRNRTFTRSPREDGNRTGKANLSGNALRRIKPSKSGVARNNVFPQNGPYVHNPSADPGKKPYKKSNRTATGKPIVKRVPRQKERAWKGNIGNRPIRTRSSTGTVRNVYPQQNPFSRFVSKSPPPKQTKTFSNKRVVNKNLRAGAGPGPGRKKISVGGRTATRPFIQRGKRNVYWGKFSKGEKAFTRDISGGPLRTRNFRSMPAGLVGRDTLKHFGRKPGGDRAYQSKRKRGLLSASPGANRAWNGDVAGFKIRSPRRKKTGEVTGKFIFPRRLSVSGKGNRSKQLPNSGMRSQRNTNNQPIPGKNPGIGATTLGKALGKFTGRKTPKGGGSIKFQGNNNNQPIMGKSPGMGAIKLGRAMAKLSGRKTKKGGGSVSGAGWNNKGQPVDVNGAGQGTVRASKFQGSFKRSRGFDNKGVGYAGNVKSKRTEKGGGSVSGRLWNNRQTAINVRTPGAGAARVGKYTGNLRGGDLRSRFHDQGEEFSGSIKSRKSPKGGGSVSGRLWNNRQTAINVRRPGSGASRASKYTGNLRGTELRSQFRDQGEEFTGTIKARRPQKGGGSISGKLWNNREQAISVRTPGSGAERAGKYAGNLRGGDLRSKFKKQGEGFSGNLKASSLKPQHSGRLKRYSGNTKIQDLNPVLKDQGEEFTGVIKVKKGYTQNPNADKESIKKHKPNKNIYEVTGLQVKVKRDKYEKKPNASELALKGHGPSNSTVKASEYARSMKMFWDYKHNPSSAEDALKVKDPSRLWERSTTFAGRTRLTKSYKRNPHSSEEALKVLAPGRAYARIGDFQGNIKMHKYGDNRLHPDAKFAHNFRNNVKSERTILMDVKLLWSKLFKKNDTQPTNVKEKVRRPRYDRGEKGLWAEDENFKKK